MFSEWDGEEKDDQNWSKKSDEIELFWQCERNDYANHAYYN